MNIELWQILLLCLFAFIAINESLATSLGTQMPVFAGCFTGIVMGDMRTGLIIGGTLQMMRLGVAAFGGASIPDWMTGAIVGTAYAISTGEGPEFGIGLASVVAPLMTQLDILGRYTNVFLLHRIDNAIENIDLKRISKLVLSGTFCWGLSRAIPLFILLFFGREVVEGLVNNSPAWLMGGLKVAGGILPVLGVAVLLRYLPVKKYIPFLLIGFFFAAYLKVPMLGVSIVALAIAMIVFKTDTDNQGLQRVSVTTNTQGGFDEDE